MIRRAFIPLFFLVLCLPMAQTVLRAIPELTLTENRSLAPSPERHAAAQAWLQQAESWFADHFGFRSTLIRLKAQIDYSIFGVSDRVYVGRNGQLFYRSILDTEKPAVERVLADREDQIVANFRAFCQALQQNGIQPILVVNLLSDRFLAEDLPATAPAPPPSPHIDPFIAELSAIPELTYVDSTAILTEIAKSRPIFHKTDFHWNDAAAFPVAQEVVRSAAALAGKPSPWNIPLETYRQRQIGGIAQFMPLLFGSVPENMLMIKFGWDFPPGIQVMSNAGIFEQIMKRPPADDGALEPLVEIGDSFADGMTRSGLLNFFRENYRIRWSPTLTLSDVARNLPAGTRYLLIQFIEVPHAALRIFTTQPDVDEAIAVLKRRAADKNL